jgi:hypothetical protein
MEPSLTYKLVRLSEMASRSTKDGEKKDFGCNNNFDILQKIASYFKASDILRLETICYFTYKKFNPHPRATFACWSNKNIDESVFAPYYSIFKRRVYTGLIKLDKLNDDTIPPITGLVIIGCPGESTIYWPEINLSKLQFLVCINIEFDPLWLEQLKLCDNLVYFKIYHCKWSDSRCLRDLNSVQECDIIADYSMEMEPPLNVERFNRHYYLRRSKENLPLKPFHTTFLPTPDFTRCKKLQQM